MKKYLGYMMPTLCLGALVWMAGAQETPPVPTQEEPEVLARGPVHEAFAEPVNLIFDRKEAFLAPVAPPSAIIEDVPDERPAPQAIWIPGYWAWDAERGLFVWVSGCWRIAPSGKRWVAGYWTATDQGWVWSAGYWAALAAAKVEYLPAPPPLENVAPPAVAPSVDVIWVPPCWYWVNERYVLRQGYWLNAAPGWVWQPSHYVWTPRGHLFVQGYWDYPLAARGLLYAPVLFPTPVYRRSGFALSLGFAVNLGWLELNMFSAPRYSHYYFGDYYDISCVGFGIYPRFQYRTNWNWYDPIYEHRRWSALKKGNSHWDDRERREFERLRTDKSLRPPQTFREIEKRPPPPRHDGDGPGRDRARPPLVRVRDDKTPSRRMPPAIVERGDQRERAPDHRDGAPGRRNLAGERNDAEKPQPPRTTTPLRSGDVAPRRPAADHAEPPPAAGRDSDDTPRIRPRLPNPGGTATPPEAKTPPAGDSQNRLQAEDTTAPRSVPPRRSLMPPRPANAEAANPGPRIIQRAPAPERDQASGLSSAAPSVAGADLARRPFNATADNALQRPYQSPKAAPGANLPDNTALRRPGNFAGPSPTPRDMSALVKPRSSVAPPPAINGTPAPSVATPPNMTSEASPPAAPPSRTLRRPPKMR